MKKLSFFLIILSLTVIFSACPPLEEDDAVSNPSGEVITYDDPLDCYKWFEILDKIAKDRKFVSLDLSKCTYKEDNTSGGLIKDPKAPFYPLTPVIFDPFPASSSGKDFIVSIILPEIAKDIKDAKTNDELTDINDEKIKDAKKYSAFKSFTRLRSVKADNVTRIGNFAFADCTALTEVVFPRVGHAVMDPELQDATNSSINGYCQDIGKYAFIGCTGLKEIRFNSAAVIGEYAFKDCTSLSKINFPEVWMIERNAFEGCKSLENVFFEKASKIGNEAFKNCTGLKKAEFNVAPTQVIVRDLLPADLPDLDGSPIDYSGIYDSVIFYPSVFTGCKALKTLNVRNAWNVYFSKDVLANIGTSIEIYLLDAPDGDHSSSGHPQNADFFDKDSTIMKKVNIIVQALTQPDNSKIYGNKAPDNIVNFIKAKYTSLSEINVNTR